MIFPHIGGTMARKEDHFMLYARFSSVSRNQWEVSTPTQSTKPIATITRCRGKCLAAITAGRALNCEELAALSCFMEEREG
jgi:hypothetical protein